MKGLLDKLQASRALMRKTEEEKVRMHNSFMETKGLSMKALRGKYVEKTILNTETMAKEASTKQKIGKLMEEVDKLVEAVDKTNVNCQSTRNEWTTRQADRTKEK